MKGHSPAVPFCSLAKHPEKIISTAAASIPALLKTLYISVYSAFCKDWGSKPLNPEDEKNTQEKPGSMDCQAITRAENL